MDTNKLTPWFDGKTKPARKGVYIQKSGSRTSLGFQYWDGKKWYSWCSDVDSAYRLRKLPPAVDSYQNDKWRGLAEPPNVLGERRP